MLKMLKAMQGNWRVVLYALGLLATSGGFSTELLTIDPQTGLVTIAPFYIKDLIGWATGMLGSGTALVAWAKGWRRVT
jgi:hypothetical protein